MALRRGPDECEECGVSFPVAGEECELCGRCVDCCQCETEDDTGLDPLALSGTFDLDEFGEEPEDEFERRTR